MSVKINGIDISDFGLILLDGYVIGTPEVKSNIIDIPGTSTTIDLTESLTGYIPYNNRMIEMNCVYISDYGTDYHKVQSKVMNFCHGKNVKLIFDNDPTYYFEGRVNVESTKLRGYQSLRITADVKPYKYSIYSSAEKWVWDTFNFLTDVANQLKELTVVGTLETTVIGSVVPTNPVITSSATMWVDFEGVRYPVQPGTYTYYGINLKDDKNILKFTGNGVVTINVRGGSL